MTINLEHRVTLLYEKLIEILEYETGEFRKYRLHNLSTTIEEKNKILDSLDEILLSAKEEGVILDSEELRELQLKYRKAIEDYQHSLVAAEQVHHSVIDMILNDVTREKIDNQSYRKDGKIIPIEENMPAFNLNEKL